MGEREIQAILSGAEFDNPLPPSGNYAHETARDEDVSDVNEDNRINTSKPDDIT